MENENQGQATPPAIKPKKKKFGCFLKTIVGIVGVLVVLGIIGSFIDDEEGGGGGGGGDWKYTGEHFFNVFEGFPKDEGVIYQHHPGTLGALGMKVMQATKKGNLVGHDAVDRVIWVVTKRRYEDGERLDQGYYIRRGSKEYTTALGAEKTVARYVEVTDKGILDKIQRQIEEENAARKAKAKAEEAAREAKEKAEEEAREAAREAVVQALAVAGTRAGETKTITLPGGVQMEMVWCQPGRFTMGSNDGDSDERPVHEVTLTKGFWMAKTEVTQAQWKSVMGENPSDHEGEDSLPVESVSWNDCQEFCEKTGLRLPTEAEWEYACRAGSTGPYAGTGKLDEMGWFSGNSGSQTHPVGQKRPNAWGLYDMHGNVCEWCGDWYGDYPGGAVTDPTGADSGGGRVLRGGSCRIDASFCRSAIRGRCDPGYGRGGYGFRPVARQD
ncbi:MAG: formylglycine-generating enzyme family protein [Kiritimatiellae bacterium]|nr:formylglycine-generating enzyme family protein [Kiritimatiellia bacterium]